MKNLLIGFCSVALVLFGIYLYLISPSAMEKQADKFYQESRYDDAAHFYQLAFREGNVSFKKERILFKIGNAYRLAGERDRSFDFYFMVLQENTSSVYKSRIQEFLREESEDVIESMALNDNFEVNLDFLRDAQELSLQETLLKRDELYKILLMAVMNDNSNLSYQLKDVYRGYKKLQINLAKVKQEASIQITAKRLKRVRRELLLIGLGESLKEKLLASGYNYNLVIHQISSGHDVIDLQDKIDPQAIYISFQQEVSSMGSDNFLTFLERLYDSYENTKIFLMIDDSNNEGLSEILDSWDKEGLYTLVFQDQDELKSKIKQSLKARFIWQSNG
ncbi:hypothetical protein MJH12_09245 [bacterium]|nr:hypothetical protein [bacterium]